MNKLGSYITKLMTTILDKEQEEFVRDLAFSELQRLNVNIKEILLKHKSSDEESEKEKEKQLLQEDK
tara:strand:- start:254 stop:454 length:201 start_codon:yes stop_codon:yes gene_type:complete